MAGDRSRDSFDPLAAFAKIHWEQGKPTTDADMNELGQIVDRRFRQMTVDTVGRAVVPRETPDGFAISPAIADGRRTLKIGIGRMLVAGHVAENRGAAAWPPGPLAGRSQGEQLPELDHALTTADGSAPAGVLMERIGRAPTDYFDQPYFLDPEELPSGDGPMLAYLELSEREITGDLDPSLIDPALGVATTTRMQTVWAVKVLGDIGPDASCSTPDAAIPGWSEMIAASGGRLTTGTIDVEEPEEACVLPVPGGFTGPENQFYHLKIQKGGKPGEAGFTFARDRVDAMIEEVIAPNRLVISRIGRDAKLSFVENGWIEVTTDRRTLRGEPGVMRRITGLDPDTREVTLHNDLPSEAGFMPGTSMADLDAINARIIRWDQEEDGIAAPDGAVDAIADDDTGLIPIPADGGPVHLEKGIVVTFSQSPSGGLFKPMDFWHFHARVANGAVKQLVEAPPHGPHRHYSRLAIIRFPNMVNDCRKFWPPDPGHGSCGCTICISPEAHNSGAQTIQAAVSQLSATGGTICLKAGDYVLGDTPIRIAGAKSLRIVGEGFATNLTFAGIGPAIRVVNSNGIRLEDLAVISLAPPTGELPAAAVPAALWYTNCLSLRIRRCVLALLGDEKLRSPAIAVDGLSLRTSIEECLIWGPYGLSEVSQAQPQGTVAPTDTLTAAALSDPRQAYTAMFDGTISHCVINAAQRGVTFGQRTFYIGATRLTDNHFFGGSDGAAAVAGLAAPAASIRLAHNTVSINASSVGAGGFLIGVGHSQVTGNDIVGAAGSQSPASAIVVRNDAFPAIQIDCEITGNRVRNLGGTAIRLFGGLRTARVQDNTLMALDRGGIVMETGASASDIRISGNRIENVGGSLTTQSDRVYGIRVSNADRATVEGNHIAALAIRPGAYAGVAGIEIVDTDCCAVTGNVLSVIGPNQAGFVSRGIHLDPPFRNAVISGNIVENPEDETQAVSNRFTALSVGQILIITISEAAINSVIANAMSSRVLRRHTMPAVTLAPSILADVNVAAAALPPTVQMALNVQGNAFSAGTINQSALIDIWQGGQSGLSCSLSNNQCLAAVGGSAHIVRVDALLVSAASNVIWRAAGGDVAQIQVSAANRGAVVGNLASGPIIVSPELPSSLQETNLA